MRDDFKEALEVVAGLLAAIVLLIASAALFGALFGVGARVARWFV